MVSVSLRQKFNNLNIPVVAEKKLLFGKGKVTFEKVKLNRTLLTLASIHDFKGLLADPIAVGLS
ncbi:hypothetical protein C2G38_369142 [Gigaspora rosea]|uniref:Uncharacterized protein n=1 Tax=Gigaspora rosea TaxID=44941 RepID=A0A397VTT3_9GLOM|nr:hypothetical protein C2G38_369142 [Gigaspora rosea]